MRVLFDNYPSSSNFLLGLKKTEAQVDIPTFNTSVQLSEQSRAIKKLKSEKTKA